MAPVSATAPVPAASPVPPTSVSMASIDPSMASAIAQPMAAATMAQPIYGASPSRTANQVCAETRRRKVAYGLCQCLEIGSLRSTVSTGTLCCCKRSRAILKLIDGAESGTHYRFSEAWDQESRDTAALTLEEYARLNRVPENLGEPPIIH